MSHRTAPRASTRRPIAVGPVVIAAAIVATLVLRAGSPSDPTSGDVPPERGATTEAEADGVVAEADGVVTEADGVLPDGATAFDDEHPGVANLDPELLKAVRAATAAANGDGVPLYVNSGWRSAEYQEQLLREAVSEHGSEVAAARWVATADTSAHVSGDAVDIGDVAARAWLSEHGAQHGLCQIYLNEPWHYELRPDAVAAGCPAMYADAAQDPRMGGERRPAPDLHPPL